MLDTRVNPNRVRFAKDKYGQWVYLQFTVIENPHILIVGGSQTGKTTLQIVIAAVAASLGCIVVVLDPKLRFGKVFRHPVTRKPLPHVLVYRDEDPDVAAQEWEGVLDKVVGEQQRRYRMDSDANENLLADQNLFPTVLVVADELGTLLDFADKEWPKRKPDHYKGDTPTREHLHTLTRMGAEARVIGCFANQTASEKEMPAGTRTRQLCGQRIALGNMKEGVQWRMIAGEGTAKPEVPDGQKGAGVIMVGDRNPERIQTAFIDWKNDPGRIYDLAAQGIPLLRAQGHIDDNGHVLLGGVPVPPPGRMAWHVATSRGDMPRSGDATSAEDEAVPKPVDNHAEPPLVKGNRDGAEFCGMTVSNFRKYRELYPIDGETRIGNQPAWPELDLREWAHRMEGHRKAGKRNEESA